jgi:HK97 family phage major capsid protein
MPDHTALVEQRAQFAAKQKELGDVMAMAKDGAAYDLGRKTVLEALGASDAADALDKVKARNRELEAMNIDLANAEAKAIAEGVSQREAARNTPISLERGAHQPAEIKHRSWGERVTEAKEYKGTNFSRNGAVSVYLDDIGLKTLMETTAGFAPEATRSGLLVEAATRPIQVLDLIPTRPTTQNADKYMEETTHTNNAAEKAEGVAYAESVYVWTERSQPVEKVTNSLPVTDEQLEDAPQVASIINTRLTFGLRQRIDLQVLVGDGTAPNLKGILDHSIQEQAKGADPIFDAVFKALTKVRVTGRAMPNAIIAHPNDWQDIRLTRTADGQYIMGPPSTPGATTLFGLPVAISDALTENSVLIGDFLNFCYISERRGVDVQVGYVGDQFKEGKRTIRADVRVAMTVTRANAFCKVTGA